MGQQQSTTPTAECIQLLRKRADEQIELELAAKNLEVMKKRALELSERRERFTWEMLSTGTITGILFLTGSFLKRKDVVVPIAALIMGVGYRYDAAFGENSSAIRDSADKLLKENSARFDLVGGPITLAEVDALRRPTLSSLQ